MQDIEKRVGLAPSTLSKVVREYRTTHSDGTIKKIAAGLKVTEQWLRFGGPPCDGPKPTGWIPPRPGTEWKCLGPTPPTMKYKDLGSAWRLARMKAFDKYPREEVLNAGADMPIFRPIEGELTADLVIAISNYAWETLSAEEQTRYTTAAGRAASNGSKRASPPSGKIRTIRGA